jgi:hypothetical protein
VQLTIDFRSPRGSASPSDDPQRRLHASDLALAARRPRRLAAILRPRYDRMRLVEGRLPPTVFQAAALLMTCAIRAA